MKTKTYLNLTNGLEYLPQVEGDWSVIRIQSSLCERKKWEDIILDLDYDFLLNLALGNKCIVVDYSAKRIVPRAFWQGLEWVKYVLELVWFQREYEATCKGKFCLDYFRQEYLKLDKGIDKVKYFRKFLLTDKLNLAIVCSQTNNDSKYEFYKKLLEDV